MATERRQVMLAPQERSLALRRSRLELAKANTGLGRHRLSRRVVQKTSPNLFGLGGIARACVRSTGLRQLKSSFRLEGRCGGCVFVRLAGFWELSHLGVPIALQTPDRRFQARCGARARHLLEQR